MTAALRTEQLTLAYDRHVVVRELGVAIPEGKITALVGPNGCGKSTLLRGLARLLKPRGGAVYLDGEAIATLPTKAVAKRVGVLPQGPTAPEGLTVRELVAQGRYPHQSFFQGWSREDEAALARALELTRTTEFADRPLDSLSGGQRQRAWIAMTLAQETPVLLLDEPTVGLDIESRRFLLEHVRSLCTTRKIGVLWATHLIDEAEADSRIIVLHQGRVLADGARDSVVAETGTADIREAFDKLTARKAVAA